VIEKHNSIRVILLNDKNELLLMYAHDPSTTRTDGTYNGPFWFLIGGEIEENESPKETALREIFEETGIKRDKIALGPVVWNGEFDLILSGQPRRLHQIFIVAKAKTSKISLQNLTETERKVVKKIAWFSLDKINLCDEIIYPVCLPKILPDILAGKYPKEPLFIDMGENP